MLGLVGVALELFQEEGILADSLHGFNEEGSKLVLWIDKVGELT